MFAYFCQTVKYQQIEQSYKKIYTEQEVNCFFLLCGEKGLNTYITLS